MGRIQSKIAQAVVGQALGDAKFIIVELGKDGSLVPVYDHRGELMKFTDGKEAARAARDLSDERGTKCQPRPVSDDKWRQREMTRMKADYLPLPWHDQRWWVDLKPFWVDHYPHASVDKEAFIAFTETPDKGAADIQTRIKCGRYLETYFGSTGVLNPHVIRDLCSQFSSKYEDNIVLFAKTADEMEDIYTQGPPSCMSHPVGHYKVKQHPVRMYAAGDLELAYLRREGRVVARTVVWPDKKLRTRIYGDSARLSPLLSKMGYREGAPVGARLAKVQHTLDKNKYVFIVPHVDDTNSVHVDGEHLRVGPAKDGIAIQFGGGTGMTELLGARCPTCETHQDMPTRYMTALVNGPSDADVEFFCKKCAANNGVKDPWAGVMVHRSQCVETADKSYPWVWQRRVGTEVVKAEDDGRLYIKSSLVYQGRKYYTQEYVKKNFHKCKCGKWLKDAGDCVPSCRDMYGAKSSAGIYTTITTTISGGR